MPANHPHGTSMLSELWHILGWRQRRRVLAAQVVSLLMAACTVGGIAAIAPFFAVLGDPQLVTRNALLRWLYAHGGFSSQGVFTAALGAGFIVVIVLANLVTALGTLALDRLAMRIGTELQTALFAEYLHRPYPFHAATNSATLYNNVVNETRRTTNGILQQLFTLFSSLATAALIVVSILLVRPAVAGAMLLVLAGGYALIYAGVRNRVLQAGEEQSRAATEQALIVDESLGAIKEILVLQVQEFFRARFERVSAAFARATSHSRLVAQTPRQLMECVAAVGLVSLALLPGGRDAGVGSWLGELTFLAFASYRLLPALQQAFAAGVRIRADRPGLALIAADLRRGGQLQQATASTQHTPQLWQTRPSREIRLAKVSFRYGPERPWVLAGVSLTVAARTTVGVVGANGAGKTTLVDLIAGLLVPACGEISVDGERLDDTNRPAWQARIAYVPQNVCLLDASIAHNIALGVAPERIDRERLQAAAQLAQLEELIAQLPRGLEHPVGERGIRLSGGQRQRIGIARALYRDASVLLLDEATDSLDGMTERELMATLARLHGRYTVVSIVHRMSTVRACDVIFELEGGRLVASGTYEDLIRHSAGFRRMAGAR